MSIYDDMLSDEEYLKKYDLKRNPFDKISAESMTADEIAKMHVITAADKKIASNLSTIINGGSATVALIGEYGSGKSIRASSIKETLIRKDAFVFYTKLPGGSPGIVTYALFESVCIPIMNEKNAPDDLRELAKKLWEKYREINSMPESKFKPYEAGQDLASLFKKISENDYLSGLIIDEFEEIIEASIQREIRKTFEILREYFSHAVGISGHITIICSTPNAWASLKEIHPAVATRVHVEIEFKPVSDKIAIEIVRKRLGVFRPAKPDSLDPFDEDIISQVNKEYATGNPRMLLLVLRSILDVTAQNNLKQANLDSVKEGVEFAREKLKDAQSERIKQILTPKMRDILEVIIGEKDGGPIVGTALADELGMDQGNLSRYLNQMAALNFLNKNRDGRIVSFEIKPELRLIFAEELGLTDE
ncbi:MAG: helix-turn-helix transcriptional regulator [Candidatus Heimdallarchaeota archaeon]|nr:helix-turn-helix transcriptional regulator [Candidatus Heimdallarchaeota archaeon]MCK5297873.1 helix-turn-helix transcriptional regulator [Candidatus Heimdallarchaeota archaeon]